MARGYVVSWEWLPPKKRDDYTPKDRKTALEVVHKRLSNPWHKGRGYRIQQEGKGYGAPRTLKKTVEKLNEILPKTKVGDLVKVKSLRSKRVMRIYTVQTVEPHAHAEPPSGARGFWHPKIVHVYEMVFGRSWPQGKPAFWGAYNCRMVRGSSSTYSMHSNWPPVLAIDIGCDNKALGDAVRAEVHKHIPGLVSYWWGEGAGGHFDHCHFQVGAQRSGRPACA